MTNRRDRHLPWSKDEDTGRRCLGGRGDQSRWQQSGWSPQAWGSSLTVTLLADLMSGRLGQVRAFPWKLAAQGGQPGPRGVRARTQHCRSRARGLRVPLDLGETGNDLFHGTWVCAPCWDGDDDTQRVPLPTRTYRPILTVTADGTGTCPPTSLCGDTGEAAPGAAEHSELCSRRSDSGRKRVPSRSRRVWTGARPSREGQQGGWPPRLASLGPQPLNKGALMLKSQKQAPWSFWNLLYPSVPPSCWASGFGT